MALEHELPPSDNLMLSFTSEGEGEDDVVSHPQSPHSTYAALTSQFTQTSTNNNDSHVSIDTREISFSQEPADEMSFDRTGQTNDSLDQYGTHIPSDNEIPVPVEAAETDDDLVLDAEADVAAGLTGSGSLSNFLQGLHI